jgi:diguanylate cyclase (GGDEF)-like protein
MLKREWARASRGGSPLALIMIDADFFKNYYDEHGHQAGDNLLQRIGAALMANVRYGTHLAARYREGEFAILIPGDAGEEAMRVAERIRRTLSSLCHENAISDVHLSFGLASIVPRQEEGHPALVAAADGALYCAKKLGRNRAEIARSSADQSNVNAWSTHDQAA